MASALTIAYQNHLAKVRSLTSRQVEHAWSSLGSYNRADVDRFLGRAVPQVQAGQRQAVHLTNAYMARFSKGKLATLDMDSLTGAGVRAGVDPAEVYARPFVNVWTALGKGVDYLAAVHAGLDRARSTAEMDVALSSRAASVAYAATDDRIVGFQRVPDGGACDFCSLVSGQRYHSDSLMPLHNRCGCTVEPLMGADRHLFTGKLENDVVHGDGISVAVHEHGELGPLITNGADSFTGPDDFDN
jgi:hypothetical protein